MYMFAFVPLVPLVVCGCGGLVISFLAFLMAIRWLKKDPHKDMVIFMGPKQGGKSELLSAVMGKPFDPERPGTGVGLNPIGAKDFIVCDSDGATTNIKTYVDNIVNLVKTKQPDFVLVILVFDIRDLPLLKMSAPNEHSTNGKECSFEQKDTLAGYLDFFASTCEENARTKNMFGKNYFAKRYSNGHWAYAIIATHLAEMAEKIVNDALVKMHEDFDQYSGKMRFAGAGSFELSKTCHRKTTVSFITNLLKRLHSS